MLWGKFFDEYFCSDTNDAITTELFVQLNS